ncbi:electron transport complex subunit RsxC [Oceanisphaera pacifica]|uniref:Ion-translocating oxidoreductase complex subunit C n=1 Tax=Oceanisphaera pacifica TaxID=2818389 RepID=A0ABS3NDP0_9GAMM|nr:electron transport complex subunit RsxC [Oceanisphaera pacifica]MBO1518709.1 electron transport complex subunit RsxC [Oceanisphaera pacifica]
MTLLEQLKAGKLHHFHGGIHPSQRKAPANLTPISEAGLPNELILQVRQHIGQAAQLKVAVGERVLKGQLLTQPLNPMMMPVHAPTSGTISAIEERPLCHPSGLDGLCIVLTPDGEEEWRPRFPVADYQLLDADVLLNRIHQAGITGLGGAGFPAHVKLTPRKKTINTLIINGVECEPYISADDRLMREYPHDILQGIHIMRHIVQPTTTILAIEDNKPEAIAALTTANQDDSIVIVPVPTKYPSGGEKQLIEVLTGLQVPRKGLPADLGIVVQNVGTAFAVKSAIIDDEPLIRRVVTLAGEAFSEPGNAWVHIGTPVRYLLQRYGLKAELEQRVIMGGPMMGFTLHTAAAPIIKGSNCVLAPKYTELPPPEDEMACIRCSQCADACPASLLPQQLYWYARNHEHDKLNAHNLFDCIECGACAYVCPSNIPLVQYYREAKADIRQAAHEAVQAERAKVRFEARQERLAREKAERQARQAKAAAERKARMAEQAAATGEDPVAAALARVKARQQAAPPKDMAAARAARKEEARRNKALKQAAQSEAPQADGAATANSDKQSAVAAAVARAKARKAAQQADNGEAPAPAAQPEPATAAPANDKKAAIQAAVARAKARKAAQQADNGEAPAPAAQPEPATAAAPADDKKAAIQAAVARAKARKAAQQAEAQAEPSGDNATDAPAAEAVDDKKAAIKAAVARAKARKAAQQAEVQEAKASSDSSANKDEQS